MDKNKLKRDNASRRKRYAANKEKHLIAQSATRYKISKQRAYELRVQRQLGVCDICSNPKNLGAKNDFCIDHDHVTGDVRGVLCRNCNLALGYFQDNIEIMNNAIKYLKQ